MQERELFDAALALTDPGEQENYVRQACGDNVQMREHLLGLLQAQRKLGSFLEGAPIAGVHQTGVHVSPVQHPGDVIGGRYKLLEQIGTGGMGAVWMAEQKEPVKRKVAIKLVKAGMDSTQVLARFEAERQALALMDHPNIAKVFDGGMTEQGRPFFVMEFVRGVPLTDYCNEARLSLKERLNLFIQVCQAVQHAHQKGIIHRDLKPSNILICLYDGEPVPKVIDFGLAKAMFQSLTENTIHTAFGMMVGTPLYMSPEQAEHNNLDVDTRTDIYSLGVILYELLTGTTPLEQKQLKEAAYNEILRLIKEVEPPKPSTRLSGSASLPSIAAQRSIEPKQLSKSLSGDLDWIVMKALDKERSRRYETANALVREIHRYLDGQPVEACPPSTLYRVKKFVSRNRTSVAVAACFLMLVLGSSVVSWALFVQAKHARDQAIAAQAISVRDRDRALDAQRVAAQHLRTATSEKERADSHARALKQKLYDYNIIKANAAYRDKQLTTVSSLLGDCLPEQRGWEWSFLQRQASASHSFSLPGSMNLILVAAPGGDKFFTIDGEGVVRCLSSSDGNLRWSQKSEVQLPANAVVSPGGDQVLIAGSLQGPNANEPEIAIIQAFSASDGKLLWSQRPTGLAAYLPAFNHDGAEFLVTAMNRFSNASEVQIRASKDGHLISTIPAAPVAAAIFDKTGGKVFVSETKNQQLRGPSTIRCLNAADQREFWKISRNDEVSGILLSPDGADLLATGKDLSLILIDPETGELKQRIKSSLAEDGLLVQGCTAKNHFLTVSRTGHFVVWDWQSKRPIDEIKVSAALPSIQLTADGSQIVYRVHQSNLLHVRPTRKRPDAITLVGHGSGFKGARFLDKEHLCSVGNEKAWRFWETSTGQELAARSLDAAALEIDVAPNGKWIAAATTIGTLLWDRPTGQILQTWPQDGQTWFVKFNATGSLLATAGQQGTLRVYEASKPGSSDHSAWSTKIDRPILESPASASIHGLAISQDGDAIYTLSSPGCELLAWAAKTGGRRIIRSAQAGQTGRTAELSPDGRFIAVGIEKTVEIWDIKSNSLVATLKGANAKILSLTFDRTGTRLFAGSSDGAVTLWTLASAEQLLTFQAHASYVVCLAMSPDNSTLASTSHGGELKLWETRSPTPDVLKKRDLVQEATQHANRLLVLHKNPRSALEQLARDKSFPEHLMPTAIAILQARINAPVNLQALAQSVGTTPNAASNPEFKLKAQAQSLKEQIDAAIAKTLPNLLAHSEDSANAIVAHSWNTLARNLAQKSRFNLEPSEVIVLLEQICENGDAPHYILYLKAIVHINQSEWEAAEREMSRSIELVPPKSSLWFVYAFRLSFLRAYVGEWDAYDELCSKALDGFKDSNDLVDLERLAKMCLFSNRSQIDAKMSLEIADRALARSPPGGGRVFAQLTKGIADLRRANYETALERFEAVARDGFAQDKVGNEITVALSKMYAAIACHHLHRREEARKHFEESAQVISSFPAGTGWWPDWMMATIVMKEAKQLISHDEKGSQKPAQSAP
jgi:serine/threonine protein kinase/WD40 repeat protein